MFPVFIFAALILLVGPGLNEGGIASINENGFRETISSAYHNADSEVLKGTLGDYGNSGGGEGSGEGAGAE